MVDFTNLIYEKKARIAYVTLNRPTALNALNRAMLHELRAAMQDAQADPEVGGVIVSGGIGKAFVAGADITEIALISAVEAAEFTHYGQAVFELIETLGKPVIAAINGFALGGGCELAMACTLRLATPAAQFGQPEVKLGVTPGFGGTQRLPRLIGRGRALQMILTGDPIDCAEAHRIGLVNEIVSGEELIPRAEAILHKILRNAPLAVRFSLQAVEQGLNASLREATAIESALFSICAASADKREGTAAFLEKRPPSFTGH